MERFPWMFRGKGHSKGQILKKQILDIMSCSLYKPYTNDYFYNGRIYFKAKKFPPTEQFPQHILITLASA